MADTTTSGNQSGLITFNGKTYKLSDILPWAALGIALFALMKD